MTTDNAESKSILAAPLAVRLRPAETVQTWGKTLIVAPHPDDESLGCGGAVALLRKFACSVAVVVMSDGALSHPNSKSHPAERLRDLREREMLAALQILGVAPENATFLRYRDRSVPNRETPDFAVAVRDFAGYLRAVRPATILLPWRRDPHPDHCAAAQIARAAKLELNFKIKFVEYPIWLWELAAGGDAPTAADRVRAFRLDISSVTEEKQRAIAAHRSQTTDLIQDDPAGFRLTPEILRHFAHDWEIYLEPIDE